MGHTIAGFGGACCPDRAGGARQFGQVEVLQTRPSGWVPGVVGPRGSAARPAPTHQPREGWVSIRSTGHRLVWVGGRVGGFVLSESIVAPTFGGITWFPR
jgi:hypothetical protein